MAQLITIKNLGQTIQGYALPNKIDAFPIPSTVIFPDGYTAVFHKETTGIMPDGKPFSHTNSVPDSYSSVKITGKNINRQWLETAEGLKLRWDSRPGIMFISNSPHDSIKITGKNAQLISVDSDSIVHTFGKTIRKAQIGLAVVGWSVTGIMAYKKWNTSNVWKAIIVGTAAFTAYSTYKIFQKPTIKYE